MKMWLQSWGTKREAGRVSMWGMCSQLLRTLKKTQLVAQSCGTFQGRSNGITAPQERQGGAGWGGGEESCTNGFLLALPSTLQADEPTGTQAGFVQWAVREGPRAIGWDADEAPEPPHLPHRVQPRGRHWGGICMLSVQYSPFNKLRFYFLTVKKAYLKLHHVVITLIIPLTSVPVRITSKISSSRCVS